MAFGNAIVGSCALPSDVVDDVVSDAMANCTVGPEEALPTSPSTEIGRGVAGRHLCQDLGAVVASGWWLLALVRVGDIECCIGATSTCSRRCSCTTSLCCANTLRAANVCVGAVMPGKEPMCTWRLRCKSSERLHEFDGLRKEFTCLLCIRVSASHRWASHDSTKSPPVVTC